MSARSISLAVAVLALSAVAHAHDCSGGPDGGMDATGNQCNEPAAFIAPSTAPQPAVEVARADAKATPTGAGPARASNARTTPKRPAPARSAHVAQATGGK